ncbi:hypothetical protein PC116_g32744 [Phytophthora cactorum]|nr:hypothetical protein PC116_g32744 [Phytophthora cactorum]
MTMAAQNATATSPKHHSTLRRELDESGVVAAESPACAVVLAPGVLIPVAAVLPPLVFDGDEEGDDDDDDEDDVDSVDEVLEVGASQSPLMVLMSVSFVISISFVPQFTYCAI